MKILVLPLPIKPCKINSRKAFTLAEILISLLILGVIAALTIPTLITNINEKHFKTAWKEAYSEIAQAQKLLNVDYDGDLYSKCDDFDDYCLGEMFSKKISSSEICYYDNDTCQKTSYFKDGTTSEFTNINAGDLPILLTNKGYTAKFRMHNQNCTPVRGETYAECGWVQVDVNGVRPPNVAGKDIFFILLLKDSIKAFPSSNLTITNEEIEEDCNNGAGTYCSSLYLTD